MKLAWSNILLVRLGVVGVRGDGGSSAGSSGSGC